MQIKVKAQVRALFKAQVKVQVKVLIFDKAPTAILAEYSDYNNIFSTKYTVDLLKHTKIYNHAIKLEKSKQLSFDLIYSLKPVELETLKIYIKTILANSFIWSFKSLTIAFILFNRKPNKSFCLYIDHWGFNNITIKNQYLLFLIGKLLDWLSWAKRFT